MLKNNYEPFSLDGINLTKYMFFTGKGGVGKTSTACAVAVNLADNGKSVLLISTDPASNLQDVFNTELDGKGVPIDGAPGLVVANLTQRKLPESIGNRLLLHIGGSCRIV